MSTKSNNEVSLTEQKATSNGIAKETCTVKSLKFRFDIPLHPRQIPQWRGAVVAAVGREEDIFHNHPEGYKDRFAYRYPNIQYRTEQGQAAIWGMGQGASALHAWILSMHQPISIDDKEYHLRVNDLQIQETVIRMSDKWKTYRVMDWLPLNQDNYARWRNLDNLTARVALLEEVLAGHLLSFLGSTELRLSQRLEACLLSMSSMRKVRVHDHDRLAFNVLFRTNIILPPRIALGRSVAFGFGVTQPVRKDLDK